MSILINKHRIMGLLAEIEGLSQSISGIDGVRRSGGVISGLLEIDGDLSISGDILFTESNFYIDQENRRFGINITTPSGQLHIYNSSGDAGMTFDGSGTNGLKFIVKSPDFDLFLNESGIADINHQDSGTFNFDRYSNDEGRVYSADGFHAGYNTFYQYMGTINSRVAFYGGMLDKTLAYQSPEGWTLVDGSGIGGSIGYKNPSTGSYPPYDDWYTDTLIDAPTGTVVDYFNGVDIYEPKIQLALEDSAALTIGTINTVFGADMGINKLLISDISEELPNGEEVLLCSASISEFCGIICNVIAKTYYETRTSNFHVTWTDSSIFKRIGTEDVIAGDGELEGVTFKAVFNLPKVEVYTVNESGHTVILGGLIKKLRKSEF